MENEKKGRKPSKRKMGFLTENERKFLQGEGTYTKTTTRYFNSVINRKAKQAFRDLNLVFSKTQPALIPYLFPEEANPSAKLLITEGTKWKYSKNYVSEFQRRQREGKKKPDAKTIKRETMREIIETVKAALNKP